MSSLYTINNWRKQDVSARSPIWKQVIYDLIRPWLSRRARKHISKSTLKYLKPSLVLPERGFPLETRRRWATCCRKLQGKTILVQGTGTGWDVISWAELKPLKIIATDLYSFDVSWKEITSFCSQRFGVDVFFYQAPLEDHSFLDNESIDLCASDAVYEHCKNLPQVIQETKRVLKSDGFVYAGYGPLWFCASGNHINRGGLKNAYNHLILERNAYKDYISSIKKDEEDFQSGFHYTELDLFSYLTTSEYLKIFQKAGFILDELILELSSQAVNFMQAFPERFRDLEKKYQNRCNQDDFLIKANFIRLKKSQCL